MSFSELVLCFFVALVVLGPERLPVVVRTIGRWVGLARGYMNNLSREIERETQLAELKKQVAEAEKSVRDQAQAAQDSTRKTIKDVTEKP